MWYNGTASHSSVERRTVPPVLDRIRRFVEQNNLLSPGETLVVGVSGGPDSLCLLHLLCRLRAEYDLSLHVAHLHHGQRGADADADAEFVRTLAAAWGLPCTIERADVPALAAEHRLAFEEAARRARYAFLSRVAAEVGARTIAVGHNADDQAETVLMHFIRGSGLAGQRGMLPKTPLTDYRLLDTPNSQSTNLPIPNLIRPLLTTPRADIEAYCAAHNLHPRFDRSNLDTTYFRNWLRHQVIPLLESHNPNLREVLHRSAEVAAGDYALLRSLLEETWPRIVLEEGAAIVFDLEAWRALPLGLQRSTLREAIHRLRRSLRNIDFVHVEDAVRLAREGTTSQQATLPQGLMLTVGYDRLTLADVDAPASLPKWPLLEPGAAPVAVRVPGETLLPGSEWVLHAELLDRAALPAGWQDNADPWRAYLDAQAAAGALWLRTRQPGDRFQPLGLGGHSVKLADFLTNQKVPHAARDRLPLLVGERGILWVGGQRSDGRCAVRTATQTVLLVRLLRPSS
jgi:tRNA(Ile)-lysidine synthase